MKQTPILFSTQMVQAIMELRKTQTRRIIKFKKKITNPVIGWTAFTNEGEFSVRGIHENGDYGESFFKMPYTKGVILWVRETFVKNTGELPTDLGFVYKAELGESELEYSKELGVKWKPSIFMPKEAARNFLKITNLKIERIQEISEQDAIAEGVEVLQKDSAGTLYRDYEGKKLGHTSAIESFKSLWCSINGKESWDKNPFVWVIAFEKTNK